MMKWNEWPKLFSVWYSQPSRTPREGAGGRQYWDNNSVVMFLSATWQWYVREKLFIKLLYRFWYKQQLLWFYKRTGVMSTLAHFLLRTTASLTRVRRLSVQQTIFIIWLFLSSQLLILINQLFTLIKNKICKTKFNVLKLCFKTLRLASLIGRTNYMFITSEVFKASIWKQPSN